MTAVVVAPAWTLLALGMATLAFGPSALSRGARYTYAEAWDLTRRLTYTIWGAGAAWPIAYLVFWQ